MRAIPVITGVVTQVGGSIAKVTLQGTATGTIDLYDGIDTNGKPLGSIRTLANYMADVDFNPRLPYSKLYAVVSAGTAFIYVVD